MNVEQILRVLQQHQVAFILIGGMNFLLRHLPVVTFDVDFWIDDSAENRRHCEQALAELGAQWGESEATWGPVTALSPGWLDRQGVYCLATPYGSVDIFRCVSGLGSWAESRARSVVSATAGGVEYIGLSDEDMLKCQYALAAGERKLDRIRVLEDAVRHSQRLTMTTDNRELLAREEAKRDRMWDPAERWRVLQETIAWAEQQLPVPRNTPAARLAEQSRKLEAIRRQFGSIYDSPSESTCESSVSTSPPFPSTGDHPVES